MTNDPIAQYLDALESAMSADDPALRQDALHDAEVHLRAELEEGGEPASIIERYGSASEIAASYRDADALVGVAPPPVRERRLLAAFFGSLWDPRAWSAGLYLLLSLVTGTLCFSWVVTGISLSLGLAILVIGIPVMVIFLSSIRGLSLLEGRVVEALLGERMPRRPRRAAGAPETGIVARVVFWVRDLRTWTSIAYMLLLFPLGVAYFTFVVMALALTGGLVSAPVLDLAGLDPAIELFGWEPGLNSGWGLLVIPLGVLVLVASLHAAKAIGMLHGRFAKHMLVGR